MFICKEIGASTAVETHMHCARTCLLFLKLINSSIISSTYSNVFVDYYILKICVCVYVYMYIYRVLSVRVRSGYVIIASQIAQRS